MTIRRATAFICATAFATSLALVPAVASAAPPGATAATYYKNCTEVRNAGKAPLREGDDGYADHLDRDGDGIACE
ncbi:hypothetical protein GOEFS_121_00390 [Gordonia effusa NBRC 100432]|uniref:Excalibur calcium-binding domain-containing protein n=1 Tax=Gordonia effusa NBRC 100432 TaxID=1077974 RepID=H0R6D6_9ACTN|nr:excalibur calcium-binding domain-containing protein [Gordonia effusa]GAB20637.1 hypothetical protein GOEFS_121_00390 [Gordonia effusa NBRC 100432]